MERKVFLDKIAASEGIERYNAILKYSWYLRQIDPEESAKQAGIVLDYALEHEDVNLEFSALTYLSYAHFYNSDFEKAEYWSDRLITLGEKKNLPLGIGSGYNMKSRLAIQQDNPSLALEYLLKALDIYLANNSKQELLSCYNGLGIIHISNDELDEAYHYLQLALKLAEEMKSPARHSILVNISNVLYYQEKYQESLDVNLQSLEYFNEQDMNNSAATCLQNIGKCYSHLGQYAEGIAYLQKSYRIIKEINDPFEISKLSNIIGDVYIMQGDYEAALKYLQEAEELATENDLKLILENNYNIFSSYYDKLGDYKSANQYLIKLLDLNKLIAKESHKRELNELETKYKTQIYKLKNVELDMKNQVMNNQISELNKSQEKLQNTYKELQDEFQRVLTKMNTQDDLLSSQSRMAVMGGMISTIAHQWKQPLNAIWLLAQGIGDAWDFDEIDDEFMSNQLKLIEDQVIYMSETVNDFRNFFKEDYQKEFSVSQVIEKSLGLLSYSIKDKGIKVETELSDSCHLSGNPNELMQVLINIINNAKDAIISNNVVNPQIRISLECDPEKVIVIVYNTGSRIAEHKLEKVFEPYYTTRGKEGTGIGLSICRQIIENKYNGTITAKNCDGGVEFVIEIIHKTD